MASSSSKKPRKHMAVKETKPHMISAAASMSSPTPPHINSLTDSLVTQSVSLLVRVLTETSDMDEAAGLAESTFKYLEQLGVDCTPLSERVSAYISCQNELKKIEEDTKVKNAYAIRTQHLDLSVKLHQAQAVSQTNLEKLLPLRTRVEEIREKLKKGEEELRVTEEEVAHSKAEVDHLEEELQSILPLAEEAEMEIKNTEQRRDKASATVNLITEELLPLK